VLTSVIKAKYIFEFDLSGFFNSVRLEAMADTLNRMYLPKYMIAYMVNITSCEVENISKNKRKQITKKN
jgi:hypothetical protein